MKKSNWPHIIISFLFNIKGQNDIPRVNKIVKACLKTNSSVNAIIDKLNSAINGTYKVKQFEKEQIDLGILVLRIGGDYVFLIFGSKPILAFLFTGLLKYTNI